MQESERFLLIDEMLTSKKSVSLQEFQAVLQVSVATVKRDLRKMRELTDAPIVYLRERKGYSYDLSKAEHEDRPTKPLFAKHRMWFSEDELYVLADTLQRCRNMAGDDESALAKEFATLITKIRTMFGFGEKKNCELLTRIKVFDTELSGKKTPLFPLIGSALCEHRRMQAAYEALPGKREFLEISPLRLVHKDGVWYLDVFNHQDREFRTLLVDALTHAEMLPKSAVDVPAEELEKKLDGLHTADKKDRRKVAELVFDSEAAPIVLREQWQLKQKSQMSDGRLRLTVLYGEESELLGKVLKWGKHVEVKAPEELRRKVCTTLEQILSLYR